MKRILFVPILLIIIVVASIKYYQHLKEKEERRLREESIKKQLERVQKEKEQKLQEANENFKLAQELLRQGKTSEAKKHIDAALNLQPGNKEFMELQLKIKLQMEVEELFKKVDDFEAKREWDKAIEVLLELLEYKRTYKDIPVGKDEDTLNELLNKFAHNKLRDLAEEYEAKGKLKQAQRALQEALERFKDKTTQDKLKIISQKIKEEEKKEAEKKFNDFITQAKKLENEKKYLEAADFYKLALPYASNKKFIEHRIETNLKKHKETEELFKMWVERAKNYKEKEEWQEALKALKNAMSYKPLPSDIEKLKKEIEFQISVSGMVLIPEGTAIIGDDKIKDHKESKVKLKAFYMDKYEVSNSRFKQFIEMTGYPLIIQFPEGQENYPVMGVNLEDAQAYCKWLGRRLPTEIEWERAARGDNGLKYPWGNSVELNKGNFSNSVKNAKINQYEPLPVDDEKLSISPFGIYGLSGNVLEWTSTQVTKENKNYYILKGGSFLYPVEVSFSANRFYELPHLRLVGVGFRCVKDVE